MLVLRVFLGANVGRPEPAGRDPSLKQDVWTGQSSARVRRRISKTQGDIPSSRKVLPLHSGRRKNTQTDTKRAAPAQKRPV